MLTRAAEQILPLAARIDHPRFFGFIPASTTWPGVLADFLVAGHQVNQSTWLTSSGPSQLELVVIDWIRRWIGYPEGAGGLLTSGGSVAAITALVAAREAAGSPDRPTVYMSDQSHSAQIRAAKVVGVRPEYIRLVASDGRFRLDMEALRRAVADDRAAGLNPIAVCANAGAGSTGAIDPLDDLADYCKAEGIWLHVDGAYGGFATITDRGRRLLKGMERADSIGLDAHKWLFQPYEAGCLMVKDVGTLKAAFGVPSRHAAGHDLGCRPSQFLGSGTAGEPLGARAEDLGVGQDIRDESIPESRLQRDGVGRPGRGLHPGEPDAGDPEPRVAGDRLFQSEPGRCRPRRAGSLGDQSARSRKRLLERAGLHVIHRLHGTFSLRLCILNHTTTWDDVRETLAAIERYGAEAVAENGAGTGAG